MNNKEKAEMLKSSIFQLYSKEGRSISYISKLLDIDRKSLSNKIREWNLPEPKPARHVKPSTQKFINKNKDFIKARLDRDISISQIAKELGTSRDFLQKSVIPNDKVLEKAKQDYINRKKEKTDVNKAEAMIKSSYDYNIIDLPNEEWKSILGYEKYMVSNMGRVKSYSKEYRAYHLLTPTLNKNNGRLYVKLSLGDKERNLQVANLVAHAFVEGYDSVHRTANHEDGDILNNKASNLSWISQAGNNLHAYRVLNRCEVRGKKYKFKKIIYMNKYEFKTVAAFARFLGKSETQVRRYLDHPTKHNIKLIA